MKWTEEYWGSEEQEFWEGPACPICGSGPFYLGPLGNLHWWRCRACGLEHSTASEESCARS